MVVTAIFLFAIDQYLSDRDISDSAAHALWKGEGFLEEMDHKYPSMYYQLELGSSWPRAAEHLLQQLKVHSQLDEFRRRLLLRCYIKLSCLVGISSTTATSTATATTTATSTNDRKFW